MAEKIRQENLQKEKEALEAMKKNDEKEEEETTPAKKVFTGFLFPQHM